MPGLLRRRRCRSRRYAEAALPDASSILADAQQLRRKLSANQWASELWGNKISPISRRFSIEACDDMAARSCRILIPIISNRPSQGVACYRVASAVIAPMSTFLCCGNRRCLAALPSSTESPTHFSETSVALHHIERAKFPDAGRIAWDLRRCYRDGH